VTARAPGTVVWFTGLPASGKSTLARRVGALLRRSGERAVLLDGDEVRAALVPPLGYSEAERDRFYRTLANLAALLAAQGVHVLVPATAPRAAHRRFARRRAARFIEVHVATPLEDCRRRDPKGLYRAFRGRRAPTLPGPGTPYEPPASPEVVAGGGRDLRAAAQVASLLRRAKRAA
jgi:adenylylsulfate kinase